MRKVPVPGMVVIIQNEHPGRLNNFTKKYCDTPYQTGLKWTRTAKPTQRNKKISKKSCTSFERQTALFNGASVEAIT